MFSVDDETVPKFVCPPYVNLEKFLSERAPQPPGWSQLQALPSLTKEQKEKLQSICDDNKREFNSLFDELKALKKAAEQRRAREKSAAMKESAVKETPPSSMSKAHRGTTLAPGGAHLPRTEVEDVDSQKTLCTESPEKTALKTMLSLFTVSERDQFDALVDRIADQNKSGLEKVNIVLTESNWKELNDMKAGRYLPDHLKPIMTGDADCMMEMSHEDVPKK
ncbi:MAG: hypothetical protein K2W95_12535 [Candidatus Obscuribacterales bacterium]|nr:hypothetical protein [Candidatus Obscuribacterales bacterium]